MCGFAGIVHFGEISDAATRVVSMAGSMLHRGPDDDGYWSDRECSLGFRRLSIVDIAGGHQPMEDIDKSLVVVFNGEIYNHLELRKELETLGHCF
jgi:asparagine synthase (glutamine-hydrolysing)